MISRQRIRWFAVALAALAGSCFAQPPDDKLPSAATGGNAGTDQVMQAGNDSSAGGIPEPQGNQICTSPVLAAEALNARVNVVSDDAVAPETQIYVSTLFDEFKSQCGACHYEASLGDFHFSSTDFFLKVDKKALVRMMSDDPAMFMPPANSGGVPWSTRKDDAVTHLVSNLKQWIDAGSPPDVYFIKNDTSDKPYQFSGELGTGLTNLGSCLPDPGFAIGSATDDMDKMDAMFAAAEQKPYEFGKVVPAEEQLGLPRLLQDTDLSTFDSAVLARNGLIAYVPTYPLWTDGAGKLRYVRVPRGTSIHFNKKTQEFDIPPNTRFYKTFFKDVIDRDGNPSWRKMETRLIVSRPDKIVDGKHVVQSLFATYQWDEDETRAELVTQVQRNDEPFKDVLVTYTPDEPKAQAIRDQMPANLTYELEFEGALRRYAIPGRERCVQCHMGSHSSSFVLGFTPLQIRRRKTGGGGTYEETPDDELSQLSRLISYGLITGIDDEDDVKLLEDVEGDRKPRNEHELNAQAYMLGNCSHCHNPNGFPSQASPELAPLLDFFPDADGGIYQFPLERYSPRIRRGPDADPIAYITPSLRDIYPLNWNQQANIGVWTPKFVLNGDTGIVDYFDAPWRSLIYRNTQNAFPYADDYTLYPHMPMNTAGFDCRAQRLLGEWMVSIPAVRKHPEQNENYYPQFGLDPNISSGPMAELALTDRDPQPYVEVVPTDAHYADAVKAAEKRLDAFHADAQYGTCLMPTDIVDPEILRGNGRSTPLDTSMPPDGVPDQPHWVITDLTERAGPWNPRRADWQEQLITDEPKESDLVVPLLRQPNTTLRANGFEQFATTPLPMAVWKADDSCDFKKVKKASDYSGAARPRWLDVGHIDNAAPVFEELPGQAVFDMICINCHGPLADSHGRQADTVQMLTGGETRVANLRDGLFGPPGKPGQDIIDAFGVVASPDVTSREWAARYMSWMALGGTERVIPKVVLAQVARTDVSGTGRSAPLISVDDVTANMLASAREACKLTLPKTNNQIKVGTVGAQLFSIRPDATALIEENGDAELWQQLCSYNNKPVIRAMHFFHDVDVPVFVLYPGDTYPANAPVGDQHGQFQNSFDPKTNTFPFCIDPGENPTGAQAFRAQYGMPPLCPDGFVQSQLPITDDDALIWANRGAINAGFAVFLFLEKVTKGELSPIRYNECSLLSAP